MEGSEIQDLVILLSIAEPLNTFMLKELSTYKFKNHSSNFQSFLSPREVQGIIPQTRPRQSALLKQSQKTTYFPLKGHT